MPDWIALMTSVRREVTLRPLKPVLERFAFHVFHDEEVDVALLADVVKRADVRMIEASDRTGLAQQTFERVFVNGLLNDPQARAQMASTVRASAA